MRFSFFKCHPALCTFIGIGVVFVGSATAITSGAFFLLLLVTLQPTSDWIRMWRYCGLAGLLLAAMQPAASDRADSRSRDTLDAYFNQPKAYTTIKVNTKASATEVEICADVCDFFVARLRPESPVLWDAIFLFKAIVSRSADDQEFGAQHRGEAQDLLARMTRSRRCGRELEARGKALCVLGEIARRSALERAEVKYDEGNRCVVYRSLDAAERVVRSRCSKVTS